MNIRVVLADDFLTLLARVRQILEEDFEVVATVENGREAVAAVNRLDPDVLVIDIAMPVLDGLRTASMLRDANCRVKIVFLTVQNDRDFVQAAFAAGASGYVLKSHLATDLIPAIYEALLGHLYTSPALQFRAG